MTALAKMMMTNKTLHTLELGWSKKKESADVKTMRLEMKERE